MGAMLAVCLATVLWWGGNAWADSYLVSGAGTAEVNGVYEENGTNDGKPMYEYTNGSTTYYLLYIDEEDRGWIINTDTWAMMLDESYYYNDDYSSETPPTTGWEVGWDGDSPAPTIGDAGPALSYSRTIFKESAYNDGSIDNDPVMEIIHNGYNGEYYLGTAGEDFVAGGKVTVSNLPAGLTAEILFVDSLTLAARLRSIASAHTNAEDTTLVIAFGDSAFNSYDASGVYNSTSSTVTVDFIQEYGVGTGGDFTTITSAISGADDGDILNLTAETFTEAGITVDKDLIIRGQGAENTIVQANAAKYTATNRVFLISTENTVTLQDMSVRHGNVASRGGGIYNYGTLIVERCAVYDNRGTASQTYGGGIYSSGDLTVLSSVIYDNSLTGTIQYNAGGGICIGYGTVLIDNSTITGNSVMAEGNGNSVGGGGIYISGDGGTIRNSTICGNASLVKGGGISVQSYRTLYLKNTIVADNTSGSGPDIYTYTVTTPGIVASEDYNLIEDVSDANITGTTTHNITGSDPALDTLADNGGPTYTCALQSGSPAINAGDPDAPGGDQRDYTRNGTPDIGAFEYTGTANTPPTVTSTTVDTTKENEAYSYTGTATDAESTPTISFADLPSWLTAAGDAVSGTPPTGAADTSFMVIADDGDLADSITVTLYIETGTAPANQAPVAGSGTALDFDGSDDYVNIPDADVLDVTASYTLEAWIYARSLDFLGGIIGKYHTAASNGYTLRLSGTSPYSGINFDEMTTANGILKTDAWYHIAAVNDNGTRHVYVNGVEQSLSGTALTTAANTDPLTIGVDFLAGARYFNGAIDEVRVWNTARTLAEITADMHRPLAGNETGLVGYWRGDENAGDTLFDAAAAGNDGVLTNMDSTTDWISSTAWQGRETYEDDTLRISAGYDPDDDALTISSVAGPGHGTLACSDTTVTYVPAADWAGQDTFTYQVSDGLAADSFTVIVTVDNVNDAPVITTAAPDTLSRANEAYSQQVSATDADGDSVMYSLLTAPSGMAINGSGLITWTPDTGHVGTNAVSVQATDDNGGYDTLSYSITVLDPVYAEEIVADTGTYLFCGIGVTLHILDLTGTGTITARVYPDSFPPDLPGSNPVKRFFEITRDSSITDITVEVTFTYDQAEFAASDIPEETTLYGARYTGTEWMPYGSTTDTAANTVTLTTTEFSLWSIGGDGGGLPVTLSSFEAEADDGTVVLTWATESEQDNLGFNVWRSADGSGDFDKVNGELIPGAGTVTGHNDYSFDDVPPSSGTWYYRLEQVDNQGQRTIVAATSVDVSGTSGFDGPVTTADGRPAVRMHTPARVPAVTVTSGTEQHLSIGLYDAEGAFHGYLFTGALPAGTYEFTGNGTTEPGVYYMYVQGDGWETALKVIIIK